MKKKLITAGIIILSSFVVFGICRMGLRFAYEMKYGKVPTYHERPSSIALATGENHNGFAWRHTQVSNVVSGMAAPTEKTWEWMLELNHDTLTYEPIFADSLLALEGQVITLSGFIVPLEETPKQSHFALSCYPISECFFCGKSGPESVMEVYSQEPVAVRDGRITLRGTFELNRHGDEQLYYILTDAELVE